MKKIYRYSLLFLTLLSYSSVFVSPENIWIAGFLSLTIPLFILYHLAGLIFHRKKRKGTFYLHLVLLVVGFPFLKMTIQMSNWDEDEKNSFKVLSYNVRVFNNYAHLNEEYSSSKKMISWVIDDDSPIKCFQEFYNQDNSEIFNVAGKLKNSGWKHSNFKIRHQDSRNGQFGQAIFSRYPIVKSGEIKDEDGKFMNSIWSDIIVDEDTIRVYCIHLESMAIDEENVTDAERIQKTYLDTGYRLKSGFINRSIQVNYLMKSIIDCPHPVIISGDINEVPYSYTYFRLRQRLNNSFEAKGKGFGFSYNGKLFFLRIDNQFYSDEISIKKFTTHRKMKESDHFPISSVYSLEN